MEPHHELPVLLYYGGFLDSLAWFSFQIFCLNNKLHFALANANICASFKRKMVWKSRFCSFTNNKQTCEWSCQRFRPGSRARSQNTVRSRNQSDCRIWRIQRARKLGKKLSYLLGEMFNILSTLLSLFPRNKKHNFHLRLISVIVMYNVKDLTICKKKLWLSRFCI